MTNNELNIAIQKLISEIKNQQFTGTDEVIKIQQILYFDKYVKNNIDYGFDAVSYSLEHPNEKNPFDSAFKIEGFFNYNEINGKRQAVCGSISQVANIVFNQLGIKCDYVWGHFNIGSEEKPQYVGHRWNMVSIGDKNYMVDFTLGMVIHNFDLDDNYTNLGHNLLGINDASSEYDYLFFDKLAPAESIGGFKKNENGTTVDDYDQFGHLQNITNQPYSIYENLSVISKEYIRYYADAKVQEKTLKD